MESAHESQETITIGGSENAIDWWQCLTPIILIYVLIITFQIILCWITEVPSAEFLFPLSWFTLFYVLVAAPSILIFTMIAPSTVIPTKLSSMFVYFSYFMLFNNLFIFSINIHEPHPYLVIMKNEVFWMAIGYVVILSILGYVNSRDPHKLRNPISINQVLTFLLVGVLFTSMVLGTQAPLGPKTNIYGKWIAYECMEPTPHDDLSIGLVDHVLSGYIQFNEDGTGRILTTAYNLPIGDFTWNAGTYEVSEGSFSADDVQIYILHTQTTHTYSCWLDQHYPPTITLWNFETETIDTYHFEYEG